MTSLKTDEPTETAILVGSTKTTHPRNDEDFRMSKPISKAVFCNPANYNGVQVPEAMKDRLNSAGALISAQEKRKALEKIWRWHQRHKKDKARLWFEDTLDPALAWALLAINPENRHLALNYIGRKKEDLESGRFEVNGSTIKIAIEDGRPLLNDGQHRCSIVLAAGRHYVTGFCFGVSRDSRETLGRDNPRTTEHVLQQAGLYTSHTASAANALRVLRELETHNGWFGPVDYVWRDGVDQMGAAVHFDLTEAIEMWLDISEDKTIIPRQGLSLVWVYLILNSNYDRKHLPQDFIKPVLSGLGLPTNAKDPRVTLNRRLKDALRRKNLARHDKTFLTKRGYIKYTTGVVIRAWMHWRVGNEKVEKLYPVENMNLLRSF